MSWGPRRPSTPTLPHSPRELKQHVVGKQAQHPREYKRGHSPTTDPNHILRQRYNYPTGHEMQNKVRILSVCSFKHQ